MVERERWRKVSSGLCVAFRVRNACSGRRVDVVEVKRLYLVVVDSPVVGGVVVVVGGVVVVVAVVVAAVVVLVLFVRFPTIPNSPSPESMYLNLSALVQPNTCRGRFGPRGHRISELALRKLTYTIIIQIEYDPITKSSETTSFRVPPL